MLSYLVDLIIYCVISFLNFIIKALGTLVGGIISLLPKSPFVDFQTEWLSGVKYIEWFQWIIPIDAIIGLIGSFIIAVLGYYIMKWVLNWIKLTN